MTGRDASGRILLFRDVVGLQMALGIPAEEVARDHDIDVAAVLMMDLIYRRKREVRARTAEQLPKLRTYRKSARPAAALLPSDGCQFPVGTPREPGFRHCGAARVEVHLPYCRKCACRAYTTFEARRAA